jgi:hypothetical protein
MARRTSRKRGSRRRIRPNHHLPIGGGLHIALKHPISAYENYVYTVRSNRETGLPAPFVDLYLLERADGGRFALGFKRDGSVVLQTAAGRSFPVASVDVVSR